MRIYFAANTQPTTAQQKLFVRLVELLYASGISVISNLTATQVENLKSSELERMEASGENMIDQVDGIIIESTKGFAESGYLVAIGLAHKKPILFLTQEEKMIDRNLLNIKKEPSVTKLLHLKKYHPTELETTVLPFLHQLEQGSGKEKASIKFTLRITKKIERYLQWKTANTTLSKADYLRDMIEALLQKDTDFQKFITEDEA